MSEFNEKKEKREGSFSSMGTGNTHATGLINENSNLKFETAYSIDYLTFSFPFSRKEKLPDNIYELKSSCILIDYLHELNLYYEAKDETHGSNGFRFAYDWKVPVDYVGEKNSRTRFSYFLELNDLEIGNFELTGACCRDFERRCIENHKSHDIDQYWHDLLTLNFNNNGSFSRIDIAFDLFNIDEDHNFLWFYEKIFLERSFSSPITTLEPRLKTNDAKNTYDEQILYVGSMHSDIVICIYNKLIEQLKNKKPVDFKTWLRIEIRFKNEQANKFIAGLLNSWDNRYEYIHGVLKHYIQIKTKPAFYGKYEWVPRNIRKHWHDDSYWSSLFEEVPKRKLIDIFEKNSLIEKKKDYLVNNYAKFLTKIKLSMSDADFKVFLNKVFSEGMEDLKTSDLEMINVHRNKQGLRDLDYETFLDEKQNVEIDLVDSIEEAQSTRAIDELQERDIELTPLKDLFNKYEKTKDLNLFVREFKRSVGDNFNSMSAEEIKQILDSLLLFLK